MLPNTAELMLCYCMVPCKQRLLWLNMDVNWEWGGNVSVTLVGNTFNFILFFIQFFLMTF